MKPPKSIQDKLSFAKKKIHQILSKYSIEELHECAKIFEMHRNKVRKQIGRNLPPLDDIITKEL